MIPLQGGHQIPSDEERASVLLAPGSWPWPGVPRAGCDCEHLEMIEIFGSSAQLWGPALGMELLMECYNKPIRHYKTISLVGADDGWEKQF